jgi:hypothetical protein
MFTDLRDLKEASGQWKESVPQIAGTTFAQEVAVDAQQQLEDVESEEVSISLPWQLSNTFGISYI